jgi:hypothetical protein
LVAIRTLKFLGKSGLNTENTDGLEALNWKWHKIIVFTCQKITVRHTGHSYNELLSKSIFNENRTNVMQMGQYFIILWCSPGKGLVMACRNNPLWVQALMRSFMCNKTTFHKNRQLNGAVAD